MSQRPQKDSSETLSMERGARQGFKESSMIFNIVFQLLLKEVNATCEELKVRHLSSAACEWSLENLEHVDHLWLIAEELPRGCKLMPVKYAIEMGYENRVWMNVGSDLEQSYPQFDEHGINRVTSYTCFGSPAMYKGLDDNTRGLNMIKTGRQWKF